MRVAPYRGEGGRADGVGVGRRLDIHRAAYWRAAAAVGVDGAAIGHGDVMDALLDLPGRGHLELDHLDAVEVCAERVAPRCNHEGRGRIRRAGASDLAAHRHTLRVADGRQVRRLGILGGKVEAAEEANGHAWPGGGVRLPPDQGIEDIRARVLPRPHPDVTRGHQRPGRHLRRQQGVHQAADHPSARRVERHPRLIRPARTGLADGELAPEVVVVCRSEAGVGVGAADQAEPKGVAAQLLFNR